MKSDLNASSLLNVRDKLTSEIQPRLRMLFDWDVETGGQVHL